MSPREVKAECPYQKEKNQGWVGMHTETLDPKSQKVPTSLCAILPSHHVQLPSS